MIILELCLAALITKHQDHSHAQVAHNVLYYIPADLHGPPTLSHSFVSSPFVSNRELTPGEEKSLKTFLVKEKAKIEFNEYVIRMFIVIGCSRYFVDEDGIVLDEKTRQTFHVDINKLYKMLHIDDTQMSIGPK